MSSRKIFLAILAVAFLCSCTLTNELTEEKPDEFPKITFKTTEGDFTMQLLTRNAPKTCEQFLQWCKGVKQNDNIIRSVYEGLNIYNIEKDLFIQTGDPFNSGVGQQQFTVTFEKTFKRSDRGTVFLPNGGTSVNSSIFCVLLTNNPKIGDNYTVFAVITQGLEVCDKISQMPFFEKDQIKSPQKPIKIEAVVVTER